MFALHSVPPLPWIVRSSILSSQISSTLLGFNTIQRSMCSSKKRNKRRKYLISETKRRDCIQKISIASSR
jgi:hypothetical protein